MTLVCIVLLCYSEIDSIRIKIIIVFSKKKKKNKDVCLELHFQDQIILFCIINKIKSLEKVYTVLRNLLKTSNINGNVILCESKMYYTVAFSLYLEGCNTLWKIKGRHVP